MARICLAFVITLAVMVNTATGQDTDDGRSLSAIGNSEAGELVFRRCQACHNPGNSQGHKLGPNLDNIFGRMAGTSNDYNGYSKALRESAIIWSEQALDQWLSDPQNYLPGNKMPFAGIRSAQDRADLMAYLREVTE